MVTVPSMWRHRMSLFPSPLKSSVPRIVQSWLSAPGLTSPSLVPPFRNQMTTVPLS